MKQLHLPTFLPPFLLLAAATIYSVLSPESFLSLSSALTKWILDTFGWLFSASTLFFMLILIGVYFSPLGKVRIGGKDATPLLSKPRWFAITLCTTIATGILFWSTIEPLYHIHQPPNWLIEANTPQQLQSFAMSTMYLHWSFSPYSIYSVAGLLFALVYYQNRQSFSVASLLYPLCTRSQIKPLGPFINAICLFSLIAGMAASLGAGLLLLSKGFERLLPIDNAGEWQWVALLVIGILFVASSISGLLKGIRFFSFVNLLLLILFLIVVLILGPTQFQLELGWRGFTEYLSSFMSRSTASITAPDDWSKDWTTFYWANWMAWAPVTALFLGKISRGYTVRTFLRFNWIYPSLFGIIWMAVFGGTAIAYDQAFGFWEQLQSFGPESVVYSILEKFPGRSIWVGLFILALILSYVTAADSNTTAMTDMSRKETIPIEDKTDEQDKKSLVGIKILWGSLICILSWVMISYAGIDGIRMASNIGGLPVLFLLIIAGINLVYLSIRRQST